MFEEEDDKIRLNLKGNWTAEEASVYVKNIYSIAICFIFYFLI